MNFKKAVTELCSKAGIKKEELAKRMEITDVSLSILLGKNSILTSSLVKIARLCNHSVVFNFIPKVGAENVTTIPCPHCQEPLLLVRPSDVMSFGSKGYHDDGIDLRSIVKRLCTTKGLTVSELAIKMGKHPNSMQVFMSKNSCRTSSLEDMAEALDFKLAVNFIPMDKEDATPICPHCHNEVLFLNPINVTSFS